MEALDSLGLTFALASSAADACHEAAQKAVVAYLPHPELVVAIKGGIIAITFFASYFYQEVDAWSRLIETFKSHEFLKAWLVSGAINVCANFLMIMGMKRGQISDTVPFLSLSPIFLLASGYIFLDESLDCKGMVGVATVALGGLWLSRASVTKAESKVAERLDRYLPPGAGIYIFIAFIQSISSAFDKRGVRAAAAPVLFGGTISSTVSLCAFFKFIWQASREDKVHETQSSGHSTSMRLGMVGAVKAQTLEETYEQDWSKVNIAACRVRNIKNSDAMEMLYSFTLTLFSTCLKMAAYWCQLKASDRIYSAQLSAIRKSGMLLVVLLGRLLFQEEISNKLLPVSTMIVGVGLLAGI
jgi:drug/metabolite transporter (DMT)-like permease